MTVRVLESNVLHASDVIYWLDGTTGVPADVSSMQRVARTLLVEISEAPADLQFLLKSDRLALWRRPSTPMVPGAADETQRTRPPETPFTVRGVARDPRGDFNPRRFSVSAGSGAGHGIVMYPAPKGVRFGNGGGVLGSAHFAATGAPASWALVTLAVAIGQASSLSFRGQADGQGDFMLSLARLPPLPRSDARYVGTLSIEASPDAGPDEPVDPSDLVAMRLGELHRDRFATTVTFNVTPGNILQVRSFGKDHLAVQAV